MATELHISISAERIISFGSLNISNSMLTSLIVSGLLILFFMVINFSLNSKIKKPKFLQNIAEYLIESFYGLVQSITNDHQKTRFFLPFFMAFFIFIMMNNWFGLLPGVGTIGFRESDTGIEHAVLLEKKVPLPATTVQAAAAPVSVLEQQVIEGEDQAVTAETAPAAAHNKYVPYLRAGTADLNTTLALALSTMVVVQLVGIKYLGLSYFKKFFNFKNPLMFFVGFLEAISEFAKVLSFSFRLFGNIFAGEVLLIVIGALVPVIIPIPFYGLEIFVGFIQALVFSMLSLVFFNIATQNHEEPQEVVNINKK